MDRFFLSLAAVSPAFFWFPVSLLAAMTGVLGASGLTFGGTFLLLGLPSSAGCIVCLMELRSRSRLWYLCLPLCVVLLSATACAAGFLAGQADVLFTVSPAGLALARAGQAALLAAAPCAVLFLISFLPFVRERTLVLYSIGFSAVVSILSVAMIGDGILAALPVAWTPLFVHPFYEGFFILYGTLGTPWIGLLLLFIAFRERGRADDIPPGKAGLTADAPAR